MKNIHNEHMQYRRITWHDTTKNTQKIGAMIFIYNKHKVILSTVKFFFCNENLSEKILLRKITLYKNIRNKFLQSII